jgi:hypothetical protein
MGELVAPCFEHCCTMALFTVVGRQIVDQVDFPLRSRDPFDRVRLMRDRRVDTLICGGMQDRYEDVLRASGLEVISWVSGPVEALLELYVRDSLVSGTDLPDTVETALPGFETVMER